MRDAKKDEELFFATRLFQALDVHPEAVERGDPAPDFVVRIAGRVVGLELTTIYHSTTGGRPRQAEESERRAVVETAAALWEQRGGAPVIVGTFFSANHSIARRDRKRLADALVNLVATNLPVVGRVVIEYDWLNRDWFPEELGQVSIFTDVVVTRSHWTCPDAEYVPSIVPEAIQRCLDTKGAADYSSGTDEAWLLIVLDSFRISGTFQEPSVTMTDHKYVSNFDRVLLLDAFSARAWDIKVQRP